MRRAGGGSIIIMSSVSGLIIFFSYAHAREGKASKSASFARVAISLITLTH
jgi:hypothetical protein